MPGAALGAPVDTWVCGFGEHFDQVWERELGARVGEALPGVSFSPSPSPSIRFGG